MIIRATSKLLNIARITPVKNLSEIDAHLPGEWYASLVSTSRKGGSAIHFVHNPTILSVVVLGRSLKMALELFPLRASALLRRYDFANLIDGFEFDSAIEIYTTNSRSILANLNQMKLSIEWQFAMAEVLDPSVLDEIENHMIEYLIGGKIAWGQDYMLPLERLKNLANVKE